MTKKHKIAKIIRKTESINLKSNSKYKKYIRVYRETKIKKIKYQHYYYYH